MLGDVDLTHDQGFKASGLDEESPGTGRQKAGPHSLRVSAALRWLTTPRIPRDVVSHWLGYPAPVVGPLRSTLPLVVGSYTLDEVP